MVDRAEADSGTPFVPTPPERYGAQRGSIPAAREAGRRATRLHNSRSGVCIPGYDTIAERAGCARSTVAEAIKAREEAGLLSWVHRVTRIREAGPDLFGRAMNRWREIRTSNSLPATMRWC